MAFNQNTYNQQRARFEQLRGALAEAGPIKRIATALRLDPRKDEDRQETLRWMSTVLAEVEKTLGDDKKDLTVCSPESYVQAMIDAASVGIPIDGRRLADLIPRGGRVNYQINTAGFVFLVGQHYDDANFKSGIVYQGDKFNVSTVDGYDHYDHEIADPFMQDATKIRGIYVSLSYTKGGTKYQKVERIPPADIEKLKNAAKQKDIWNMWFFERVQTAAVKRIAKRQFQTILGLQEAIAYDNRQNYDMTAPALPAPSAGSIIDNLNQKLKPADAPKALEHTPSVPVNIPNAADQVDQVMATHDAQGPDAAMDQALDFDRANLEAQGAPAPLSFKACPECGGIGEHPRPGQDPITCGTCDGAGEVPA